MSKAQKVKAATSAALHGHNPKDAVAAVSNHARQNKTADASPKVALPTMHIPEGGFAPSSDSKTPKTPADEGLEFFESAVVGDTPIQVYELKLDPDGGPDKDRSVSAT